MNKTGHIVTACIVASLFATAFGGLGVVIILSPLAFLVLFIYAVRQLNKPENADGNTFFAFLAVFGVIAFLVSCYASWFLMELGKGFMNG